MGEDLDDKGVDDEDVDGRGRGWMKRREKNFQEKILTVECGFSE